jgi:hypothetical protein
MNKELDFLWSGKHFKTRDWYNPNDPHIIRMTYGEANNMWVIWVIPISCFKVFPTP